MWWLLGRLLVGCSMVWVAWQFFVVLVVDVVWLLGGGWMVWVAWQLAVVVVWSLYRHTNGLGQVRPVFTQPTQPLQFRQSLMTC